MLMSTKSVGPFMTALVFLAGSALAQDVMSTEHCCQMLKNDLGQKVISEDSSSYEDALAGYWSAQAQSVHPNCIVQPSSADDVSDAIKILTNTTYPETKGCKFAVKGSGRTHFASAANIEDGVTIDLSAMKKVVLPDDDLVQIETGNNLGNVLDVLVPRGLMVPIGGVSSVGVGGFTSGGGISIFSGRKGFACDNVANFEVVLGSGKIVNANVTLNSDLFKALKGGSNNFGIITRVDMETFDYTQHWSGLSTNSIDRRGELFTVIENSLDPAQYDPNIWVIIHFIWTPAAGWILNVNPHYVQDSEKKPDIPVFASAPEFTRTMKRASAKLGAADGALANPTGDRHIWGTTSVAGDASFQEDLFQYVNQSLASLPEDKNLTVKYMLEPIPQAVTKISQEKGGNSVGINPDTTDLVYVIVAFKFQDPQSEKRYEAKVKEIIDGIEEKARQAGNSRDWVFVNTAGEWQDAFSRRSSQDLQFLRDTRAKYDPGRVFQDQVPGGFKL